MHLLLIADTHVPRRARDLPGQVWDCVAEVDVVLHAGDWISVELLERLQARSRRLLGCWGNNDGQELRERLPETAREELAGVQLVLTHETGGSKGRELRMDRRFPGTQLLVFGHSHVPWDTVTPAGMRLLNPGSPTDRRAQPTASYMTVELGDAMIGPVTLHRIER